MFLKRERFCSQHINPYPLRVCYLLLNNSQSLICELILAPAGEDCVLQLILVHISTETVFSKTQFLRLHVNNENRDFLLKIKCYSKYHILLCEDILNNLYLYWKLKYLWDIMHFVHMYSHTHKCIVLSIRESFVIQRLESRISF